MPARTCSRCNINWPGTPAWSTCKDCGHNTVYYHDRTGMTIDEAKRRPFEKYYGARGPKPLHHMTQARVDRICEAAQQAQDVLMQLRELARSWR